MTKALGEGLDNGCYANTKLTSFDLKNALLLWGECEACIEAKMKAPAEPESTNYHNDIIASTWYIDLLPLTDKTVGGNTFMLCATELVTCFMILIVVNSYGHKISFMIFDDEFVLVSTFDDLRRRNIVPSTTPAGMKNKSVEIKIQELKNKTRAMRSDLVFNVPKRLYGELYIAASYAMNSVPNKKTGPTKTPYQIMTGSRPIVPSFKFGQIGLVNSKRTDDKDIRSEYGMFMYNMYNLEKHYKVYMLHRGQMYSKRVFIPSNRFPSSWDLTKRMRCIEEEGNEIDTRHEEFVKYEDGTSTSKFEISTGQEVEIRKTKDDYANAMDNDIKVLKDQIKETSSNRIHMFDDEVFMTNDIPIVDNVVKEDSVNIPDQIVNEHDIPDITMTTPVVITDTPFRVTRSSMKARNVEVAPIFGTNIKSYEAYVRRGSNEGRITEEVIIDWDTIYLQACMGSINHLSKDVSEDVDEELKIIQAYRVSLKKAMADTDDVRRASAEKAVFDEFDNLMDMNFAEGVLASNMTRVQIHSIINAFMFLTEKKLGSGAFDKWKARLVAGGNEIKDTIDEDDRYAPTANHISVMTSIALAAIDQKEIRSYDVKGAYLIPDILPGEKPIYIKLNRETATKFVERYPNMAPFIDINGCMILKLNKYLYGLPMAGKHWNDHIVRTLVDSMKFEQSPSDPCVFKRGSGANMIRLVLWVDDILGSGKGARLDEFEIEFISHYKFTSHSGDNISYLALEIIRQDDGGYLLSSPRTREDISATFEKELSKRKSTVKIPMPEGSIKQE